MHFISIKLAGTQVSRVVIVLAYCAYNHSVCKHCLLCLCTHNHGVPHPLPFLCAAHLELVQGERSRGKVDPTRTGNSGIILLHILQICPKLTIFSGLHHNFKANSWIAVLKLFPPGTMGFQKLRVLD